MAIRYITAPISFTVEPVRTLNIEIEKTRTLLFDFSNINLIHGDYAHYEGEYVITPRTYGQVMETEDKVMDLDITVLEIPAQYVANEKGGRTATIG